MLYNYFTSAGHVLLIFRSLIAISLLFSGVQHFINFRQFRDDGLFSWRYLKRKPKYVFFRARAFNYLFGQKGLLILNLIRILLLPCFLIYSTSVCVLLALTIVTYAVYYRTSLMVNAADQLNNIALTGLLVNRLFDPASPFIIICFFSIILFISYFTSGLLKLYEVKWRNGYFLKKILINRNNDSVGWFGGVISCTPDLLFAVSSKIIIWWQVTAFLMPFMPVPLFLIYLAIGILFHVITGICMGLINFVWTFLAFLPGLIFLNFHLLRLLSI